MHKQISRHHKMSCLALFTFNWFLINSNVTLCRHLQQLVAFLIIWILDQQNVIVNSYPKLEVEVN